MVGAAAVTLATSSAVAADPQMPPSPASVVGTVTEVVARPGPALATGAPIEGVLVSNGRDVTRTDASGHYSLSVEPGQAIFIIKPSGFRVPVDAVTKLPIFSYVHDPAGTPAALDFRYEGLNPTGPLPPSIDFQLTRVPEPQTFDVVLFTDPQPESTAEIEFVRDDVVAGVIGASAAFGMTFGDLMFDDLSMYRRYNRIIGTIGVPWWNIGGNHDLDYEAPDAKRSRDTYKRVFGATYYAHEYANALFIMLDNVDYLGAGSGKPGEHGIYRGFFPPDQLTFVRNLLEATPKERLVVVAMHIPLKTYLGATPNQSTVNAGDLLKLLEGRPTVSFAGHTHSTEHHYLGAADGFNGPDPHHHHVLTAVSGSWWSGPLDHRGIACADSYDGTPNGFHILSVEGARYTTRYVPAAEAAGRQMRISLETQFHQGDAEVTPEVPMEALLRSPITADQANGTRLTVNIFDGGPRTSVAFTLNGSTPIAMKRVARPDPFIVQLYKRHAATVKKWVSPQPSSHLWEAALPLDLRPGTYALRVLAKDEYGRDLTDAMVLEIV